MTSPQLVEEFRPKGAVLPWPLPLPPDQSNLFQDDMAELRKGLAALAEQQRALNTRRAYRSDWRDFQVFCENAKCAYLPATPISVCLYLAFQARIGKAVATITRRLAAITAQHKAAGFPTPVNADVGMVLVDIRRKLGTAQKPKTPISLERLKSMLEHLDDDVRGLRDKAILVVGFSSGCRRSELAAFDLSDVQIKPEGLILHVAKSKVDQTAKGRDIGVHRGQAPDLFAELDAKPSPDTCPVHALEKWLVERGNWPGPLFCRVGLHTGKVTRQRLAPAAIALAVKAAAKRAGMEPREYAGHSMRSGCATAAAVGGADILLIAKRLGHASLETTRKYFRPLVFQGNPLAGVL
jgi:site-specific recombinase XerD